MPMIPSPIASADQQRQHALLGRSDVAGVRVVGAIPLVHRRAPSTTASASLFETARNSSSSSDSATTTARRSVVVDGDDELDDEGNDEGDDEGDDGAALEGRGGSTGRPRCSYAGATVGSVVDDWLPAVLHPARSPPSAAPPAAVMRARREYMKHVYPALLRNACGRHWRVPAS